MHHQVSDRGPRSKCNKCWNLMGFEAQEDCKVLERYSELLRSVVFRFASVSEWHATSSNLAFPPISLAIAFSVGGGGAVDP